MYCPVCGDDMHQKVWGDNYSEPREEAHYCYECDLSISLSDYFGIDYTCRTEDLPIVEAYIETRF